MHRIRLLLFILLGLLLPLAHSYPSFEEFKKKYGYQYSPQEEPLRRETYNNNVKKLEEHPCPTCGITKFSAHTPQEIDGNPLLTQPCLTLNSHRTSTN